MPTESLHLRPAKPDESPLILAFIRELAEYEKLGHEVVATVDQVSATLFGEQPFAEVVIAEWQGQAAGFALFFTNYSTFLARPGIYLEDLFVRPTFRGRGIGKALLSYLAQQVRERDFERLDWSVLDWNQGAIDFYKGIGAYELDDWHRFRVDGEALDALAETD